MALSTARITSHGQLDRRTLAHAFVDALRERARGRVVRACQLWAVVEDHGRRGGAEHLAVQAAAQRSVTLMWAGALPGAAALCDRLVAELAALERDGAPTPPPPIDRGVLESWAGAWFSLAGLHRLRAEQRRRAGDYVGALDALQAAARAGDERRHGSLPEWGRIILADALRLAGDAEGALEVARDAVERTARRGAHPWLGALAKRAVAHAQLALDAIPAAVATLDAIVADPVQRNLDGRIACDLGFGEALRRGGDLAGAQRHLLRARAAASAGGNALAWIQAQLGLAEVARAGGADRAVVAALASPVHDRLGLAAHPWLALRAAIVAAVSASSGQEERWLARAEEVLPRFRRRSGDLELDAELVERCRVALEARGELPPIALDFV